MDPSELISIYQTCSQLEELLLHLRSDGAFNLSLYQLNGSARSLFFAACMKRDRHHNHLVVFPDKEEAAFFYTDLDNLDVQGNLHFFPSSYRRSPEYGRISRENRVTRWAVLESLAGRSPGHIVISYPEAIAEKVVAAEYLQQNTFKLNRGDQLNRDSLTGFLSARGFLQVDYVYEPGHYSVRGSIMDVFSFADRLPYRIDFSGDLVDSIRSFDTETQLSVENVDSLTIVPDLQDPGNSIPGVRNRISPLEYFGDNTMVWVTDHSYVTDRIEQVFRQSDPGLLAETDRVNIRDKSGILIRGNEYSDALERMKTVHMDGSHHDNTDTGISFDTVLQPPFSKNFELLLQDLKNKEKEGYRCFILSDNPRQLERIGSILSGLGGGTHFNGINLVLHKGFTDHQRKIAVYTDHQIFDRYHRFRLEESFTRKESLTIRELTELHPGDYVVHIDHGIGRFGGLEKIDLGGRRQEAVKLVYQDHDILYVSIHSLHRISKYKGKDSHPPRIYKLGTAAWQKLKEKTKKRVKDIARELIDLYARRKAAKGYSFSPDSYLQQELEASFMFEETEDQLVATRDTKSGMEADFPMDRLICGDVGFGKTEVAIRAAFKAVADSKQVAVLVPTTILALQHYRTFTGRLGGFPCTIQHLSRLKSQRDQSNVIRNIASGQVDIVIGTHRLVSTDVRFKDLGLLIIDEEQKFGVSVKEKLRQLRVNVDTLTLTATPIPRTLQLSLMGARDLSIIHTPPPNRHPIITELHTFNEEIIREAIEYEVSRNGQVFFIHNRVQNIEEIRKLVERLCPYARTAVAHGQMEGARLEKIMLDFIDGRYDVLVATTIIESGLDIPNANTMLINNAHHFGLSELHQLRGRVGRSNRKAFCYLLAPPLTLVTTEARRRLRTIEDFSELGSGFNIAMQDLDIRGSGNLLGAEQSGFISEIGFETYFRILDEAMEELREDEYKELSRAEGKKQDALPPETMYIRDCHIDTDMELLFPDSYVENISERFRLYRRLDNIRNEKDLAAFNDELTDRFGEPPLQSIQLLNVVRLRWIAISMGFEKIILKKGRMVMHFVSDQESPYYRSIFFEDLIQRIHESSGQFRIREQPGKLTLTADHILSVEDAITTLNRLRE